MGSNTELRINLGALKRQDPYIDNITESSTHVAVYSFSPQLNEWEKTDVEGTLFVYKRVAPPYWGFTILNRLSMDNLTEPLTSELEFQTQNPFLLYRNAKLLIYGIWFYDQEDCKRIGELLEKLCRESTKPPPENANTQRVNLFISGDNIAQIKDTAPKPGSPTSNSVNSISPGSSVGGVPRPLSNGEADSESDDKEVAQSNKGSIDILDLLSKAQHKYEKEKRNTPDPGIEGFQNGTILSPTESEIPLVKPVPVKPIHPQKLDVATLFKQQPVKPPDANLAISSNGQPVISNSTPLLPTPTMNAPYVGMMTQSIPTLPPPTASVAIPQQQKRLPRPMGRSYSMTEIAMRQHLDQYLNGNVMSVEEIEAGLGNRNTMAASRQQQVNSTLDRMIDRINSGGVLNTTGAAGGGLSQPPSLPGIQEAGQHSSPANPSTGNSGSMVVNGNKALYSDSDVFTPENNANVYAGSSVRSLPQTFVKSLSSPRQRSISSSSIQQVKPIHNLAGIVPAVAVNPHFTPNFPIFPNLPLHAANQNKAPTAIPTSLPGIQQSSNLQQSSTSHLLLHGNTVMAKQPIYTVPNHQSPLVSSITTAVSSVAINDKASKVPINAASMPQSNKSSSALPTTLISPEDFERSASTPQKKLELKHRLLQDVQQPQPNIATQPMTANIPLNKEQLRQTLVFLLQKDSAFLTAIHEAYMTNFKQT